MTMIYNGMELPVIPEKGEYTSALIFKAPSGSVHLFFYDQIIKVAPGEYSNYKLIAYLEPYNWALYDLADGAWVFREQMYGVDYGGAIDEIIWASIAIFNEDGTLHIAYIKPVYPFVVTHTINADLLERGVRPRIDAVQGDSLTRRVEFILTAGGVPWTPPDDTAAALSYVRPDGAGKVYDKLPDGLTAYTVSGNRIRFTLLPEMLTVAGEVQAALRILRASDKHLISTFVFDIVVEAEPSYLVNPPETAKGTLPASIIAVKADTDVTVTAEYTDGSSDVTTITLDANGDPISVARDGEVCTLTWEGFDE